MVRFCLAIGLFFVSCNPIKYKKLDDGITKIPLDERFFDKNYRDKYEILVPYKIDTNSVYIESFYLDSDGKLFDSKKGFNNFISGIKFYGNGCLNNFVLNKDSLDNLPNLNPTVRGYRGICYKNKNDTLIEIISPIDETYNLGKKIYYLKVNNDTLFLEDKQKTSRYIYLRLGLKEKNIKYKSDW